MKQADRRASTVHRILAATADIARSQGLAKLSIDRVIERAGVSKGAFFHHFASRSDLIATLLGSLGEAFDADLRARVWEGDSFARALIESSIAEVERDSGFIATLLTAVAMDPALRPEINSRTREWTDRMVEEGMSPQRADLIRTCLDGLFVQCLLGQRRTTDEMALLRGELLALAYTTRKGQASC